MSSSSSSITLKLFIVHPSLDLNCSFASDVTAAMLLVKNKRNSKLFFHVNSSRKNLHDPQHGRLVTWLQTKNSLCLLTGAEYRNGLHR